MQHIIGMPLQDIIIGIPILQHFIMASQQAAIISAVIPGAAIILQTILPPFISQDMPHIMLMLQQLIMQAEPISAILFIASQHACIISMVAPPIGIISQTIMVCSILQVILHIIGVIMPVETIGIPIIPGIIIPGIIMLEFICFAVFIGLAFLKELEQQKTTRFKSFRRRGKGIWRCAAIFVHYSGGGQGLVEI